MDLTNQCIFCNSSDNLNTSLTIKVEDQKHAVAVCDACEDRAAPKVVKALVAQRVAELNKDLEEIQKLEELAKKHGMTLVPQTGDSPIIVATSAEPAPTPVPVAEAPDPAPTKGAKIQKGKAISEDTILVPQRASQELGDVTPQAPVSRDQIPSGVGEAHASYRMGSELKRVRTLEQQIKTSSRGPIRVPSKILDNEGGRTTIRINRMSDADLQRRFKSAAAAEANFSQGYQTRECRACGGTGISRIDKKQICPKCDGEGTV